MPQELAFLAVILPIVVWLVLVCARRYIRRAEEQEMLRRNRVCSDWMNATGPADETGREQRS